MKGLSSSRNHHHVVTCDPSLDSMGHHLDHKPYLISQIDSPHPVDHSYYSQRIPYQPDCVVPYGTFPRRHYRVPANKGQQRIPITLSDQFDRQLPVPRDGYHTLQYKRAAAALEQRSDSPGRIRHLVHSVQKLFTKSHSLEGPHHGHGHGKGSINGGKASPDGEPPAIRHRKRSKSRERCKSAEPKNRTPPSGYWSSDELEREACLFHHGPPGVMTMGRHPDKSQSQYFLEAYNTINDQALKNSRSSNDLGKCLTCTSIPLSMDASHLVKKSSWSSSLTVSRARQVYQKASVNVDKALVKAEACQQERSCQFLQVPQDEWGGFPLGKDEDIPCRRMRSGSYVKAMAEDDSGDSDSSPKPSPKMQARRASYLKATQPSLTEMTTLNISTEHSPKLQIRSHSYLRAVSEVSINRSMDTLDPKALLASPQYRSRNESYMREIEGGLNTFRTHCILYVSEVEVNGQLEAVCESVFSEMESQAVDALDLPMPGCFRMRSHSYVRAIDQGCSQDDDGPLLPASPPRTTTTVRTIQSSTGHILKQICLHFLSILKNVYKLRFENILQTRV
uniref:Discs, large (Drosophila) homolog-associated protein 1b n=1 Tax=Sinocyclocheilus anshuiensis TaxID=1608454 RepID=A0A671MT60_9TELE